MSLAILGGGDSALNNLILSVDKSTVYAYPPGGQKALIYPIYQNTHMKKTFALLALIAAGTTQADTISSNVTVAENASKEYGYLTIDGGNLTNNGKVTADNIYIANGNIVNNGLMSDKDADDLYDFVTFADANGTFTNNGRIEGNLSIIYGSLELNDGSYIKTLEVYDADSPEEGVSVYLNGNVSVDSLYLGDNTEFIFALDSSIDLGGGNFQFYDVKLVLMVDSDLTAGDSATDYSTLLTQNLFTNFVNSTWTGGGATGFTGDTLITLRDAEGDEVTRTYSEVSANIPEPATATMGLLALAARRRRA